MATPVNLPGFEGRQISAEHSIWSGKPRLLVDGQPAPPGATKGEFLLRNNDGRDVTVRVKGAFPDPAPLLEINGQTIRTARPLTPFEWVWAACPIVLLFLGGALGGGLGAFAAVTNIGLIRDESKGILRFVLCAVVSGAAFVTWLIVGTLLQGAMKGAIKH